LKAPTSKPDINEEKQKGMAHLVSAIFWSRDGFYAALRDEAAFRQELVLFSLLTPVAIWMGGTAVETLFLVGSLFLVLIVELLNTAMEATVNRISTKWHILSKKAKDVGSAAVMLAIIHAVFVWIFILYRHGVE